MHMAPHILNYGRPGKGPRLTPGMALAIEPMLTLGSRATQELPDGWTVSTVDGSIAAHWEHTVAIFDDGPWVLTAEDGGRAGAGRAGGSALHAGGLRPATTGLPTASSSSRDEHSGPPACDTGAMQVRTAEVVAVLSLATDLATRAPFEHGLRSTWYAMQLADQFGLDADEARRAYYLTALAGAGEASIDLAVLVDVPGPASRRSSAERIAGVARELDAARSRHSAEVAHSLLRGRPRRPLERRIAAAAVALEPPTGPLWDAVLAAEPRPYRALGVADLDSALAALGVFGSLVSPYFRGHSAAVSALAAHVAQQRGLPEDQVTVVRRAGLLHDLGRAGVPREIWERPGSFGPDDWAEVRAGVTAAEELLSRVPWLARISSTAAVAGLAGRADPGRVRRVLRDVRRPTAPPGDVGCGCGHRAARRRRRRPLRCRRRRVGAPRRRIRGPGYLSYVICFSTRAGAPAAIENGGTSSVTTEFAPITLRRPIVTPLVTTT